MVDGTTMQMIDFDDGGFGYRLFDIATALLKHRDAPDFRTRCKPRSYKVTHRYARLTFSALDFFILLRRDHVCGLEYHPHERGRRGGPQRAFHRNNKTPRHSLPEGLAALPLFDHEGVEKARNLFMCGHRQDRRDVLIWPDDHNTTIFSIDATQVIQRRSRS